jgi:hypothetical protein
MVSSGLLRRENLKSYTAFFIVIPGYTLDSVGIANGYGLNYRRIGVRVPVESRISLLHIVEADSEAMKLPIQ